MLTLQHTIPEAQRTDNLAADVLVAAKNDLRAAADRLRALSVAGDVTMDQDLLTAATYMSMIVEDMSSRIITLESDHRERVYRAQGVIA